MAEIVSRQAANVAANTKNSNTQVFPKKRTIVITSPATAAWADGDTLASPVILPAGTRFGCGSFASHEDFAASVVLAVGLRHAVTGVEVDLDGICASVSIASAGRSALNNGALVAAGVDYVTSVPTVVVATLSGANPTDNKQIRIEVEVLVND